MFESCPRNSRHKAGSQKERAFFDSLIYRTMCNRRRHFLIVLLVALAASSFSQLSLHAAKRKKVYMTYILHGNMNYDRYERPTIWENFPVIYNNLLDFMDEHPDFKGQVQFSGQTFGSLLQAAPQVVAHAKAIHQRGQLNFTGTFYSEPVNVNMDGETNYRCAWLGTRIVEHITGEKTDGFYLQERAYHPQLPGILSRAGVSWIPVITGDDSWKPFRLKGLDGNTSVCVPITRSDFIEKAKEAPDGSLITIEEDYEFPQTFVGAYNHTMEFNASQKETEIIWTTAAEYIRKFGIDKERYIDHAAKARHRDNGTYSRWTADPLDIQIQALTNEAMAWMHIAKIAAGLTRHLTGVSLDEDFAASGFRLRWEPLAWNIERAELYPDVEPLFLKREGKVTLLTKAEHQLLWAVNSDSKGWYPLYEKRRERMNALQNCTDICRFLVNRGLDKLAAYLAPSGEGADRWYLVLNMEAARKQTLDIRSPYPLSFFNGATGAPLPSVAHQEGSEYCMQVEADLPAYGYKLIGARRLATASGKEWHEGSRISNGGMTLAADGTHVSMQVQGQQVDIALDDFQVKALAEMSAGEGDGEWRPAKAEDTPRVSVSSDGLYPQLRIERQLDRLVHLQQTFTLAPDRVLIDLHFEFPHPTLVRKEGASPKFTFSPEGLTLLIDTHKRGIVGYDIPYGISEYSQEGVSYFCPLSSLWLQQSDGGLLVSPQTGEQAFCTDLDEGRIKLYLGASTTSGPIRAATLEFLDRTNVKQHECWYAEPFHGAYEHRVVLAPFKGKWDEAHLPQTLRAISQPVCIREVILGGKKGNIPAEAALLQVGQQNVEVTTMDDEGEGLMLRLNEREGKATKALVTVGQQQYHAELPPFGIVQIKLK